MRSVLPSIKVTKDMIPFALSPSPLFVLYDHLVCFKDSRHLLLCRRIPDLLSPGFCSGLRDPAFLDDPSDTGFLVLCGFLVPCSPDCLSN